MRIIVDDPKRAANLLKHRIDLADFEDGFDIDTAVVLPTRPSRTGRQRLKLIGEMVGHGVVAVIVSPLGSEAISVISICPASEKGPTMASDDHASGFVAGQGFTQEDWDEVSDSPETTDEEQAHARPIAEALPELVAAMRRKRGTPKVATKDLVSLRIDKDVLTTLRAGGSGWQGRANDMLRKGLGLDV